MSHRLLHLAFVWLIGCVVGSGAHCVAQPPPPHADATRQSWMGEILMPNTACPRLAFVVSFFRDAADAPWAGSFSIPRGCGVTGAMDVRIRNVTLTAAGVSFVTPPPPGENTYNASITPGDTVAKGRVVIGGAQALEIRMWRVSEEEARHIAPRRPQTPDPNPGYVQEQVTVPAPVGLENESTLSGTLTIPTGEGPFPGVVLVTDAEQHNRDHSEGTHRSYLVLADRLTRAGYAVLRCDDRGVEASGGDFNDTTIQDSVQDVLSQVKFLSVRPQIDRKRISVVGRGEGALVASMAATAEASGIASVALLAPGGSKGIDLACLREQRQLEAIGEDEEYLTKRVARLRAMLELARRPGNTEELRKALEEDIRAYVSATRGMGTPMTDDQVTMWANTRVEMLDRPRFRSWLEIDPAEHLRRLRCRVLVISPALDMMIPIADELPRVREALAAAPEGQVRIVELARTNHWMQPCTTGYEDEYDLIETTISEEVLKLIIEFLNETK